ncbi:hypothetical protein PS1_019329 [Malus domestica]
MKVVPAATLKDLRIPEVATEVEKSLRPGQDSSDKHCSRLAGAEAEDAEREGSRGSGTKIEAMDDGLRCVQIQ